MDTSCEWTNERDGIGGYIDDLDSYYDDDYDFFAPDNYWPSVKETDRMRCDTNMTFPATCGTLWGMREHGAVLSDKLLGRSFFVDDDFRDDDNGYVSYRTKQGFVDDVADDWSARSSWQQPKTGEYCDGTCWWGFKSEEDCLAFYRPSFASAFFYELAVYIIGPLIFGCACCVLACRSVPRHLSTGSCAGDFLVKVGHNSRLIGAPPSTQVTVPANTSAGDEVNVPFPDGHTVRVVVPPHAAPGSILTVEVPPHERAPAGGMEIELAPSHQNAEVLLSSSGGGGIRSAAAAGVSDLDALETADAAAAAAKLIETQEEEPRDADDVDGEVGMGPSAGLREEPASEGPSPVQSSEIQRGELLWGCQEIRKRQNFPREGVSAGAFSSSWQLLAHPSS